MNQPIKGRITGRYGTRVHPVAKVKHFHNGVDIAAPLGTPITTPWDGTVADVYTHPKGGLSLLIDHPDGYRTGYAHLSACNLKSGDIVKAGQIVAHVGNSGISTGAHLHFTLRKNETLCDPLTVFTFK